MSCNSKAQHLRTEGGCSVGSQMASLVRFPGYALLGLELEANIAPVYLLARCYEA